MNIELPVEEYLARLGVETPPPPDAPSLRSLQAAHLRRIPFENLSIHLGEPISLDIDDLADKILRRRRGGFCFELNGLFAQLLAFLHGSGESQRTPPGRDGVVFPSPVVRRGKALSRLGGLPATAAGDA